MGNLLAGASKHVRQASFTQHIDVHFTSSPNSVGIHELRHVHCELPIYAIAVRPHGKINAAVLPKCLPEMLELLLIWCFHTFWLVIIT